MKGKRSGGYKKAFLAGLIRLMIKYVKYEYKYKEEKKERIQQSKVPKMLTENRIRMTAVFIIFLCVK